MLALIKANKKVSFNPAEKKKEEQPYYRGERTESQILAGLGDGILKDLELSL
jgi:hypothetical protein